MKAKLGKAYSDSITGFEGIAVSITDWLHGCRRVGLQPKKLKEDGAPIDDQVFDEGRLVGCTSSRPGGPPLRQKPRRDPR